MEAAAPSPTAEATCFVLPCLTSPAAKIPGMLVSNGSGSMPHDLFSMHDVMTRQHKAILIQFDAPFRKAVLGVAR